jgi:hypothetical protein
MSNIPNPKSVLTVDQRDKHYGVCRRACANSEPKFVVYRGMMSGEVVAHFFDECDSIEYAKWKNRKATP